MAIDNERTGAVEKVVPAGRYGPYAVVRDSELGAITLSLSPPVWNENANPEPGTYVVLSQIRKRRAGWRAMSGRFMKPSDQQAENKAAEANSNQEKRR
jgi:hypothetical protein